MQLSPSHGMLSFVGVPWKIETIHSSPLFPQHPWIQFHPRQSFYSLLITLPPCHLRISYKSRFASSWLSCSAARKSARFSVFLGTVPLPPCFIWNVDFPQDCMSPDLFLDTCPHSPTSYCEARKHGRLFLLFPLTSSHCSLSWCPLSSFWHAAILPCAYLSSCILLLNIH